MKKVLILILTCLALTPMLYATNSNSRLEKRQAESTIPIETIKSYKQLDETYSGFDIDVVITKSNNQYTLVFDFLTFKKKIVVDELPHHAHPDWVDEHRVPVFAKYFTKNKERQIFYYWQNDASTDKVLVDVEGALNGFRPFVLWNIDTNKLSGTKELLIQGVTNFKNDFVKVDLIFPFKLDDLLQIKVQYVTTSTSLFFIKTSKVHQVTRVNGETVAFGSVWDFIWKGMLYDYTNTIQYANQFIFGAGNQNEAIENVNALYASPQSKLDFTNKINAERKANNLPTTTSAELFKDWSTWRVSLGYHHALGQTKLEVNEVAVTSLIYTYQGEYFHVAQEDITSIVVPKDAGFDGDDVFAKVQQIIDWFNSLDLNEIAYRAIIVAAIIIGLMLIGPVIALLTLLIKLLTLAIKAPFKILEALFIPKNVKRR